MQLKSDVSLRRRWRAILARFVCPDPNPQPITVAEILCGYDGFDPMVGSRWSKIANETPESVTNRPADRRNDGPSFPHGTNSVRSPQRGADHRFVTAILVICISIAAVFLVVGVAKLLG